MKKKSLLFIAAAGLASMIFSSYASGPANNGQGNRTTVGCGGGGCHGATNANLSPTVLVLDGFTPVSSYTPGKQYTISYSASNSDGVHTKYGFQITATKSTGGAQAGSFSSLPANNRSVTVSGVTVIEQNAAITATTAGGVNLYTQSTLKWTAPAAGTGSVKLSFVINSVNANASADNGDVWATTSTTLTEGTTSVASVAKAIGINAYPSPAVNVLNLDINSSTTKNFTAVVIDMTGKAVLHATVASKKGILDVSRLAAGIYTVSLNNGEEEGTIRFVKQ